MPVETNSITLMVRMAIRYIYVLDIAYSSLQ